MSEDIVSVVPEERRPYVWARNEMRAAFPNPDYYRLTNLEERTDKPNTHLALFVGEPGERVIMRVYWADTDSVKYSIITNYPELQRLQPELTAQLVRNAKAAYDYELSRYREIGANTKKFFVDLG